MKKFIALSLLVVMAGVLFLGSGFTGSVQAASTPQSATPQANAKAVTPAGFGAGNGWGYRAANGGLITIVAELTGLTVEDITAKRLEGKSLAAIASDKGVSKEKIVEKALAERKIWLDNLVKEGVITEEVAQARLTIMEQRVADQLERTAVGPAGRGRGKGFGGGRGMGRGFGAACPCLNGQ
ncbi:MAG: hypothetical protein JG764_1043 [Clostridiales bacterium]|nr:hypothetical protein [Clostridiales bacterium]